MSLDKARTEDPPISSARELTETFRAAERPAATHKVGLEHEKLLFRAAGPDPVAYDGPEGVSALLGALAEKGYRPFREAEGLPVIALEKGALTVSLEPGGQFELSGTAVRTARAAHAENLAHIAEVVAAARPLGIRVATLGYRPVPATSQMPWMPKTRYRTMRESLGERGPLALNMMLMTATGQVSLDWSDEADCVRKTTTVARLAPLMVALYANSPIVEGRPSGYASFRSRVWSGVDPARCGYPRAMIDGSFSYEAYVAWALQAPMLFLRRDGEYLQPRMTFGQFLERGFEGHRALRGDWADHLSTLFPEVRLKTVIEVRGADAVDPALTGALPALWRGLLYDPQALSDADRLLPRLSYEQHLELHEVARKDGLRGVVHGLELKRLAQELVALARAGLRRLDPEDAPLLEPLAEVAASGRSPAEGLLELWERTRDPEQLVRATTLS